MTKSVKPLMKFALTVSAAALGAGPLSTLPKEVILSILKSLLSEDVTKKLADVINELPGNLAGDYAKEFLDSLEKEPAQDLRMIYLLALRKALIDERSSLRNEIGVRPHYLNERQLPDEMENLFAAWLAKTDSLLGDVIDVEILFGDQPALEVIFETPEGPWGFLKRTLIEWADQKEIPEELELHLHRDLPKSLADHFTTILSNPNRQQEFNKHQAHFLHLLDRSLSSLQHKTDQILELHTATKSAQGERSVVAGDINAPVFTGDIEGGVHFHLAGGAQIHRPYDLNRFRTERIKQWSGVDYRLDERFVNLTLVLDPGENKPREMPESNEFRYQDLKSVLSETQNTPALVLLGEPGCGKSTLLRRLQLDHSIDRLTDGSDEISFFVQLNGYRGPDPRTWLNAKWSNLYSDLPPLDSFLKQNKALLLLDALNEMPHSSNYSDLIAEWRAFTLEIAGNGNRLVFSCRRRDYTELGSNPELTVPRVAVELMNEDQIRIFLGKYLGKRADDVWKEIKDSPQQLELYSVPYFLNLLCNQSDMEGGVPKGRASLFTGFIRKSLKREIGRNSTLFQQGILLSRKDHEKVLLPEWRSPFDLPENGLLIPGLSNLAFGMQEKRPFIGENSQVRVSEETAKDYLAIDNHEDLINAGVALNVLDLDRKQEEEIAFFHQLLQEYFAARRLAKKPDPSLAHVEWQVGRVSPSLEKTLADLPDSAPLPPLRQTGWEETTRIAVPIINVREQEGFIRKLIPHNLPLAARCAASPEVDISEELKSEIQNLLIARTQDRKADLRARIAAGEALGELGDPRFELRMGHFGEYLLPPMVEIPGGSYPIGLNKGQYKDEEPEHFVEIPAFQIGQFPVTNAEYKKFIEAGGYEDEQWWDTDEALKWLRGEGTAEGERTTYRDYRNWLLQQSEDEIEQRTDFTSEEKEQSISLRNMTDDEFEELIGQIARDGATYREPAFWDDARFNHPSQPVVGVSWFEARAYCNWLTHGVPPSGGQLNDSKARLKTELRTFTLPTEVEYEAAARGLQKRLYSYGNVFDSSRCNTFESHIRRTTPIGIFDNATPEGVYDLTGNVWTWTLSEYKDYKYISNDGREDINTTGIKRVLRGGSWFNDRGGARAVFRDRDDPFVRSYKFGFRVVVRPPSQGFSEH
ncbi:MAG: SUMF1/EgtB/PvdO family nonheme iron enzyme [Acidobacteriota bacterium]|nr:MAG: SUMF1/EgtB/PvdO family nonheme iron enzyme [Acidobacteriota bacterium]